MAQVVAVRCLNPEVLAALMNSTRFRPYLRATLAPDVALADADLVDAFRVQLRWAGLYVEWLCCTNPISVRPY